MNPTIRTLFGMLASGGEAPPPLPVHDPIVHSELILLRYDASDTDRVVVEMDGSVSEWAPSIGSMLMTQSVANKRPVMDLSGTVFAHPCLNFDATLGDGLEKFLFHPTGVAFPLPHEVLIVGHWGGGSAYKGLGLLGGAQSPYAISAGHGVPMVVLFATPSLAGSPQIYHGGAAYAYYNGSLFPTAQKFAQSFLVSTSLATMKLFKNNIEVTPIDVGSGSLIDPSTYTTIGSSDTTYASHGRVAEVLVFSRTLSTAERTDIHNHMKVKWALPV
jgi:hypothetical protein